jgi:formate hydrogenlyase subunit 3/multisubunit Na+/H+ antiporter MnhD subunit
VAQLGYLFLLFPLSSEPGVAKTAWLGAVLFALSHALAKAAMFLAAGRIAQLGNNDRLDRMTGVGQRAPLAVTATALAGVSLMGLPPSGGFAGKWMLLVAGVKSGQWWWALVIVVGGLLTAAYLFRFWRVAIAASDSAANEKTPTKWRLELPAVALGAAAVLLIFFATQIISLLEVRAPDSISALAEVIP